MINPATALTSAIVNSVVIITDFSDYLLFLQNLYIPDFYQITLLFLLIASSKSITAEMMIPTTAAASAITNNVFISLNF